MILLGLDIGTGSMKASLWKDGEITQYSHSYDSAVFLRGYYQDIPAFSGSVRQFLSEIMKSLPEGAAPDCLALSCHGPSLVCLDSRGTPLGKMDTWQNRDASPQAVRIREAYPGFGRDGTSWEAKCLRQYEMLPDGVIDAFLYPKDYINFLLTGEKGFDRSTASTLIFFNRDENSWNTAPLGIGEEVFPRVFDSSESVGMTGTSYSRECALPDGIPVLAGGIDAYCEALGAGAVSVGDITEGSGTSTCLSVCAPRGTGDDHVIQDKGLLMAMMSSTGASINWLESVSGRIGGLNEDPLPLELLFLPYLNGERSPFWDEKLQGAFLGITGNTRQEDLYRSVLQGIAFGIRQNLEALPQELFGSEKKVFAAGGGAENGYWLQMKADILEIPFIQPVFKDTASLGGLALCGYYLNRGVSAAELGLPRVKHIFSPTGLSWKREAYDDLYREYRKAAEILKGSFHSLWDIKQKIQYSKEMKLI